MDNLNLDSDERVLYTTQKLIINGIGHEAVLTLKRLILVESETGKTGKEIPYNDIELAASGTNALREPVIFITARVPDGTTQETELIFIHQAGGLNVRDRDRCLITLRDQKVRVAAGPSLAAPLLPGLKNTAAADALVQAGEEPVVRPDVPEMSIFGMTGTTRQTQTKEPTDTMPVIMVAAAVIVLIVLAGGIFLTGPGTGTGEGIKSLAQGTPTVTAAVTPPGPAPTPETTPAPTATTPPAWALMPGETPPNGIWVRITYPGQFTGSLKAQGWNSEVNSTGTYLYQLPVHDTTIEGSIEKGDGSAGTLDVEILNGGQVIWKGTTTKPYGTVDPRVDVGAAILTRPEVTAVPTVVSVFPTPDTSLVLHEIPANGVFVRVAYPGKFTGSIAANGIGRDVNSTGEQIYQLSMSSGTVDAFLEKGDGSEKNMVLQVYRNGALVTYGNTSAPLGVVEMHTTI